MFGIGKCRHDRDVDANSAWIKITRQPGGIEGFYYIPDIRLNPSAVEVLRQWLNQQGDMAEARVMERAILATKGRLEEGRFFYRLSYWFWRLDTWFHRN